MPGIDNLEIFRQGKNGLLITEQGVELLGRELFSLEITPLAAKDIVKVSKAFPPLVGMFFMQLKIVAQTEGNNKISREQVLEASVRIYKAATRQKDKPAAKNNPFYRSLN